MGDDSEIVPVVKLDRIVFLLNCACWAQDLHSVENLTWFTHACAAQSDVPPKKAPVIANANAAKPNLASAKQKVKIAELNEDGKNKGDDEDADSFSDDDGDDSGDEVLYE